MEHPFKKHDQIKINVARLDFAFFFFFKKKEKKKLTYYLIRLTV